MVSEQVAVQQQAAVQAAKAAAPAPAAKKTDAKKIPAKKTEDKKPAGKGDNKRGRRKGPGELHVAAGKSGRNKKQKGKRGRIAVTAEPVHALEEPVAPVIFDVSIPETLTAG